ncbi:MAG: transposase [Burkholderiales bacterium]|nr:transposase [Burkholderiales bacterium]
MAGLPRSTFYYRQQALQVEDKHAEVNARILTIFKRHRGRYGYRRVTAELRQQGVVVNHKTVQRLMIAMQLKSMLDEAATRSKPPLICLVR